MVPAAGAILATESEAARVPGARATVGKLVAVPGGANVIASTVDLWLDVRHQDDETVQELAERIGSRARTLAGRSGCRSTLTCESYSATAHFDTGLTGRLREVLPSAPLLDTGAGHDAGVLAAHVPSAMVFVRNPTGISHSPDEHVEDGDVDEGARALARVLGQLTTT
jgi:N-carbamoyl-L-amino-acid hydrolase